MKNLLFAPLLLLISCTGTKLVVSNNAADSGKVVEIERKGILSIGGFPAIIRIDEEKVGSIWGLSKLIIPVKEGSHTVKIKIFPYSKKYTLLVSQEDISYLSFIPIPFGIKLLDANK